MGRNNKSAKDRGAETQKWVAEWYARLWPGCTSAGSGRKGQDVVNAPVDIEVKARARFNPLEAVRQLKERPGGPFGPGWAVMRMDGQGEKSVAEFLVIMTLADHTHYIEELIRLRRQCDLMARALQGQALSTVDEVRKSIDAADRVLIERCAQHGEAIGDGRVCIACDGGVF